MVSDMARYIDAEILKAEFYLHYGEHVDAFARLIDKQPTANVETKSEVAGEIFEEIEKKVKVSLTVYLEEINKEHIKDTPLYDRCSGIVFALRNAEDFLAKLKKKYTGEQT
jgi:hypothetical protein